MHTLHAIPKPTTITMCVTSGLFVMGELVSGNKLLLPRVFTVIDNGTRIQLSPLPGIPPFIILKSDGFTYPVPESEANLLELYHRTTHPVEDPPIVATGNQESNVIKLH
jgi:hypothetical protein